MTITVRPAAEHDVPWLISQLRMFDKFAGFKRSLMEDMEHAIKGCKQMVRDHLVLIAFDHPEHGPLSADCEIELGFIAGYLTPHPFNPQLRVLTETFWWVEPKHRATRAGLLLLDAFENYGRKNCDWTVMTLEHHSPVNPHHLTKRGFIERERSYLLEA